MIVSYEPRFIYTRIPKTASTSVSTALEPYHRTAADRSLLGKVLRRILPDCSHAAAVNFRARSHWGLQAAQEVLPTEFFAASFKFTVVRHPFSWIASLYNHVMRHEHDAAFAAVYGAIYGKRPDLNAFVKMLPVFTVPAQSVLLLDYSGKVLADRIIRVERLAEELEPVFNRLGVRAQIPRLNRGVYRARAELNSHSRALLRELYRIDFDLFGYNETMQPGLPMRPDAREAAKWGKVLAEVGARKFSPWEPVTQHYEFASGRSSG